MSDYSEVMLISTGIGVTPLTSALKSIVHHRWKFSVGSSYPDRVHCYYMVAWSEIDQFRWFLRLVKEVEDAVEHFKASNPAVWATKSYSMHIFVTSVPDASKRPVVSGMFVDCRHTVRLQRLTSL